jgi:hypothetical protein
LITPLRNYVTNRATSWKTNDFLAEQATKANLGMFLGGEKTPALLVSASHGMGFSNDDNRQLGQQGAILCQDWPGPLRHKGPIPEDFYFAANDLSSNADFRGVVAFFFACFGGGTPQIDDFSHLAVGLQNTIAPFPFVASLPKTLLGHPRGALSVIGHVDRAWGYSFLWDGVGEQLATFESAIDALLDGRRVGFAMEAFNSRYADISSGLVSELKDRKARPAKRAADSLSEDISLAAIWTAASDARSYVVLGDPAVRLTAEKQPDRQIVDPY